MTHLHCTSHSHLHTSVCSVHNVQSIYDSHAGQHKEKQNRENRRFLLCWGVQTSPAHGVDVIYSWWMHIWLLMHVSAGCRCVYQPVGGAQSPDSPPASGICSSKRSRLESGLLAWQPRGDECVCVCVWGMEGSKQETIVHKQQTRRRIYDRYRWVPRWHTHTHIQRRAGGRPLWGSPWPVILSCVYLPREATHAPPGVQAGERAASPLYRFPLETHNTQSRRSHIHTAYWRWLHNQPTMHSGMRATTITHYFTRVRDATGQSSTTHTHTINTHTDLICARAQQNSSIKIWCSWARQTMFAIKILKGIIQPTIKIIYSISCSYKTFRSTVENKRCLAECPSCSFPPSVY